MSATDAAPARQHENYKTTVEEFEALATFNKELLDTVFDAMTQIAKEGEKGAAGIELFDQNGKSTKIYMKDLKRLFHMGEEAIEISKKHFRHNYKKASKGRPRTGANIQTALLYIDPAIADFLSNANFGPYTAQIRAIIKPAVDEGVLIKRDFDELFRLHLEAEHLHNPRVERPKGERNQSSYRSSAQILADFGNARQLPVLKHKEGKSKDGEKYQEITIPRHEGEFISSIDLLPQKGNSAQSFPHMTANAWISQHSYSENGARDALKEGQAPYVADLPVFEGLYTPDGKLDLQRIADILADPRTKALAESVDVALRAPTAQFPDGVVADSFDNLKPGYLEEQRKKREKDTRKKTFQQ